MRLILIFNYSSIFHHRLHYHFLGKTSDSDSRDPLRFQVVSASPPWLSHCCLRFWLSLSLVVTVQLPAFWIVILLLSPPVMFSLSLHIYAFYLLTYLIFSFTSILVQVWKGALVTRVQSTAFNLNDSVTSLLPSLMAPLNYDSS